MSEVHDRLTPLVDRTVREPFDACPAVGRGWVARDCAPVAERAAALCRDLEQLPAWMGSAAEMLDAELAAGPRTQAIEAATGYASFYRDEARAELGDLGDAALGRRLDS